MCYFCPFRQMLGLVGVCLRPVLYPSDVEILDKGMPVRANLTTSPHRERKDGVGSGEQASKHVFLPLDWVGEVFFFDVLHSPDWSWRKG